jgi:hypothetical protein
VGNEQPYHTVDRTNVLPYYQWVPFILMFQAFCFCLPNIIWHTLSRQTGIDVGSLVKNAIAADNADTDKREKIIDQIGDHIRISLTTKYEYEPLFKRFNIRKRLPFGKRHGNYLYIIYLFVKVLYIFNVFLQIFLMNFFFGFKYHSYGLDFLRKFMNGDDYSRIDMAFPRYGLFFIFLFVGVLSLFSNFFVFCRVTFCDFKIRNMADNIHQHSVQCALPINLFNEKFFISLWFWLIALACLTLWNFFIWTFMVLPLKRKSFIEKYLKAKQKYGGSEKDRMILDSFVTEYCHLDGAFIFALIRRNTNFITTSEIISSVWDKFYKAYTSTHELKGSREIRMKNMPKTKIDVDEITEESENTPLNSNNIV